jgi:hypothetical protein
MDARTRDELRMIGSLTSRGSPMFGSPRKLSTEEGSSIRNDTADSLARTNSHNTTHSGEGAIKRVGNCETAVLLFDEPACGQQPATRKWGLTQTPSTQSARSQSAQDSFRRSAFWKLEVLALCEKSAIADESLQSRPCSSQLLLRDFKQHKKVRGLLRGAPTSVGYGLWVMGDLI